MSSAEAQATFSTDKLLSFARELAVAARAETLPRFRGDIIVEDKRSNGLFDPVTEADREAEQAMRALIEKRFPDHNIQGEEFGAKAGDGRFCWSLDPIDGTRSFICGLPTWTTLIALLEDGQPMLGLIDAPVLDEVYVGSSNLAVLDRAGETSRLGASGCRELSAARLSTTDPGLFSGAAKEAFKRLRADTRTVRFGHDGYAYARLAAGTLDLVVECGLKPYDYNAVIPVVRGAGGVIGDWRGGSDLSPGNVIAAATPELYDAAVVVMREAA